MTQDTPKARLRSKRTQFAVLLLLISGCCLGVAAAQETTSQNAAPMSQSEQIAFARGVATRATGLSRRVSGMLDAARRESDVIRVNCLNDKLGQANASLKSVEARVAELEREVDADQRKHKVTLITVIDQRLRKLDDEANQCVGQDSYEQGPAKITVEINKKFIPFESNPGSPPTMLPAGVPVLPPASGDR